MKKRKQKSFIVLAIAFLLILILIYFNFFNSQKHSIQVNEVNRDYLLHVPSGSEKMPLVIALHGYKDNPRFMEFYTGLSRKADKEKFIVVYPYGTKSDDDKNLSWNSGACCGNGVLSNIDDVTFINNLTDQLIKNHNIDPGKIYLTGFSNGALLVYRIASEAPERYKGVAIVSGSIGGKVYKKLPEYEIPAPKKPIAILMMHGVIDERIPYLGGENKNKDGSFKSFSESTDFWIKNNNCQNEKKTVNDKITHSSFEECSNNAKTEIYSIKNSGHVWFGSLMEFPRNFMGKTMPATNTILTFFNSL